MAQITKEVLESKIDEITKRFNMLSDTIAEKQKGIESIQKEILQLVDEQKRLQGEYRTLVNLGTEFGFFQTDETVQSEVVESSAEIE